VTNNIHGMKINVLQTGELGTFDITTLVIQLTTSLALLKLTTTIVDLLAVRVLPHKEQYRDAKVDEIVVDEDSEQVLIKNPKQRPFNGYGATSPTSSGAHAGGGLGISRPLLPGTIAPKRAKGSV